MKTISDKLDEIDGGGFKKTQEQMNAAMQKVEPKQDEDSKQTDNRDDADT